MNLNDCAYTPIRPADFDYDAALEGLREKIRRQTKIKRQLAHFAEEATRLNSVMEDRKASFDAEQEDVDSLSPGGGAGQGLRRQGGRLPRD